MKQIELKNVSKIYKAGPVSVKALDDINLEISKGDFVAIIGPSGSGKSTLMDIIGTLTTPTYGSYKFESQEVSRFKENELVTLRREKVGFVFQTFNLISRISALANVELPMVYKRVSSKERKKQALEFLGKVGLKERVSFKPNQLSGGEIQRVAIARALANKPEVILADEPTGNLDSKSGDEVMNILKSLNEDGITIILVTHEKERTAFAKRVVRLKDGKIENEGDSNVF